MFTDLLSMTGFGAMHGMHGIVLGIGISGRVGGMYTAAGHMIGIGITATPGIIITTGAHSVRDARSDAAIMTYIRPFVVTNMQYPIRIVRSTTVTPA